MNLLAVETSCDETAAALISETGDAARPWQIRSNVVASQAAPDPAFPTVTFPNPQEPGAADALLELAARVDADLAIALDPDADRCALGVPLAARWRVGTG